MINGNAQVGIPSCTGAGTFLSRVIYCFLLLTCPEHDGDFHVAIEINIVDA